MGHPYVLQLDFYTPSGEIPRFSRVLPLSSLRNVIIYNVYPRCFLSQSQWPRIFDNAPLIRTIHIYEGHLRSFIHALRQLNDKPPDAVYAPRLAELTLNRLTFSESCPSHGKGSMQEEEHNCVECLNDALRYRSEMGHKLDRIIIRGCTHISFHHVAKLTSAVGNVDWDRNEAYSPDVWWNSLVMNYRADGG